ncbi:MAG TPA: PASTA domain-containing protein [Polyangiaceae bacterium]|nr:PASTA domain-containing protein [Polyangiaceae bacterium]
MSDKLAIGQIAASVGSQLASADAALRSSQSELRLHGLQLRLKGAAAVVDDDVGLDLSVPSAGSAVDFSFQAAGASEAASGDLVDVPDVRGYTIALARRKLQACRLGVATTALANAVGRVSEQRPGPGTQALGGAVVQLLVR